MGMYIGGLEVDVFKNKAGTFSLTFNCKPQRFLMQGEREQAFQLMTLDIVNREYVRTYSVWTEAELFDDEWTLGGDPDEWLPALKQVVGSSATKTRAQLITYLNTSTGGLDLVAAGCIAGDGTQESVEVVIDHSGLYAGYYRSMFHIETKNGQDEPVVYDKQGTHFKMYNPTMFSAKPIYSAWAISPSGTDPEIVITMPRIPLGEIYVDGSNGQAITIDTDTWEAWHESGGYRYSDNDKISMPNSTRMPELPPGVSYLWAHLNSDDPTDEALFWVTPRWWIV